MSEDKPDLGAIRKDAEKASESTSDDQAKLRKKLDMVEQLIGDLGNLDEFNSKATKFVDHAETEMRQNTVARCCTLVVVLVVLIFLGIFAWFLAASDDFASLRESPTAFSTVIVATIGGGIFLLQGVAKSVFGSFAERNAGMPMPESLKAVLDAYKDQVGR